MLEINGYDFNMDNDDLRKSDLATEEDNRLRGHISEYEKKIESLMAEVGTLKNEVKIFYFIQMLIYFKTSKLVYCI